MDLGCRLWLSTVSLLLMSFSSSAQDQGPELAKAEERLRANIEEARTRLDLTDEQVEKMRPVLIGSAQQQADVMNSYGINAESRAAGERPTRRQMRKMREEMKAIWKQANETISGILSEEQMSGYKEIQKERQESMRENFKKRNAATD